MKIKYLNGERLYYAFISGAKEVIENRKELNRINVFPVPDGDTGTNLSRTLNMVMENVKADKSVKATLNSMGDAALRGAIGNSGIIFAQFINGLKENAVADKRLSVNNFVKTINKAVDQTYQAISEPVEGTMLTVMKDWSNSLEEIKSKTDDYEELLSESLKTAKESLNRTQNTLEVLKQAHVVDSGALGFVYFLTGILEFIKTGKIEEINNYEVVMDNEETSFNEDDEIVFRYCTEAYLENVEKEIPVIREELAKLGDSLIIAGGSEKMRIHIHTNQPAEFFAELNNYSTIIDQKVDDMLIQYDIKYNRIADIAIVTDSIADLPQEYIDDNQIHVIPINLIIDDTKYLDKITITPDNFYDLVDEAEEYPTSAQPSIKMVEDKLSFLADHYESIIIITVSSNLSGTYETVKTASNNIKNGTEITIIDSKLDSGAQGLLVMEAAEKIKDGLKHEEIVEYIQNIKDQLYIYVSVDNFEYMVRGGRVSPLKGKLAGFFNLKPIVSLDKEGNGIAFAKAFSKKAITNKIKEIVKDHQEKEGIKRYSIVHGDGKERAEEYRKIFTNLIGQEPEYVIDISPVIGLNAGRNSVAISLMTNKGGE
ncbi:MAG: DegV family EDD domain-containing protein [Halanaerobiales bacterium]|nr:DegV family EDD domain-containing protein [Halanaerobiales bacterium]